MKKLHDKSAAPCEPSKGTDSDRCRKARSGRPDPHSCYPLGLAGMGSLPRPASFLLCIPAYRAAAPAHRVRISASRESATVAFNASALTTPPGPAAAGLTLSHASHVGGVDSCPLGRLFLCPAVARAHAVPQQPRILAERLCNAETRVHRHPSASRSSSSPPRPRPAAAAYRAAVRPTAPTRSVH